MRLEPPAAPSQSFVHHGKSQTVLLVVVLSIQLVQHFKGRMVVQLLRPAQSPNSVLHDRSRMVLGEALKDYKKYFEGFIVLCPAQVSHYKDSKSSLQRNVTTVYTRVFCSSRRWLCWHYNASTHKKILLKTWLFFAMHTFCHSFWSTPDIKRQFTNVLGVKHQITYQCVPVKCYTPVAVGLSLDKSSQSTWRSSACVCDSVTESHLMKADL